MVRGSVVAIGVGGLVLLIVFFSSFFIVPQTRQAIVLQFGEPRRVIEEPGLKFKVPFLQNVLYFERRLIQVDPDQQPVTLADKKRVEVDAFARYRIVDSLQFYQSLNNEAVGRARLESIINSSLRRVLGGTSLDQLLSPQRERIMAEIQTEVRETSQRYGIEVVEVRLRRVELPARTIESVFSLMRSERDREARELRAEGDEKAKQIRAQADGQKRIILAKAERDAQIIRGGADAKAIKIYADAFSADPKFFAFYRSMEAYRNALGSSGSTFLLSPDNDFLRYFGDVRGTGTGPAKP